MTYLAALVRQWALVAVLAALVRPLSALADALAALVVAALAALVVSHVARDQNQLAGQDHVARKPTNQLAGQDLLRHRHLSAQSRLSALSFLRTD